MPVAGFSHQNVRTFYKGIKAYRADERRGELEAGQWTGGTQRALALVEAAADVGFGDPAALAEAYGARLVALLGQARRWDEASLGAAVRLAEGIPPEQSGDTVARDNGAARSALALGAWAHAAGADLNALCARGAPVLGVTHRHPTALAAGLAHAHALSLALSAAPGRLDGPVFLKRIHEATQALEQRLGAPSALGDRLGLLLPAIDAFPLDLQDLCDGTGAAADESWPFAVAMFARNPDLVEATLLSAINVGGDAAGVGGLLGSLLGALHGWSAFPAEWREGLENVDRLEAAADVFAASLKG